MIALFTRKLTQSYCSLKYCAAQCLIIVALLISMIFILIGSTSMCLAASVTITLTPAEKNWLNAHREIRIGIDPEFAPYSFRTDTGVYNGVALDYIARIAEILNIKWDIVPAPGWTDISDDGKRASFDMLATAVHTLERENHFRFSNIYIPTPLVVMTQIDSKLSDNPTNFAGKRLAVIKQHSSSQRFLRDYPNANFYFVNEPLEGLTAVSEGHADAYVGMGGVTAYLTRKHGITNLKPTTVYGMPGNGQRFAVRKDWEALIPILNKTLEAIYEEQGLSILNKWIPFQQYPRTTTVEAREPTIGLTEQEVHWLQAHPAIRVSNEMDWPPYDFAKEGKPTGFSIDYLELIAQKLGVTFEYVNGYSWAELVAMIKRKELDVIHPLAVSDDRQKFMNFTDAYLQVSNVIVIKKTPGKNNITSIKDLSGKTLAIGEGYIFQAAITAEFPEITILPVINTLAGLKAVSFGEADAYIDTLGTVDYLIKEHFIPNLEIVSEFDHDILGFISYHIATRKDWPILRDIIQKAINAITVEEKRTLIKKWNFLAKHVGLVNLSLEEKEWLTKHNTINLAIDPKFAPVEFNNAKGEYVGITADYVKLLSELLNVTINVIPDLSWSEAIALAKQGKIDLFSAITPTSERREYLNFTQPYINYPFVILTRSDYPAIYGLQSLLDKKVVVVKDYVMQELVEKHFPDINLITSDSIQQGLSNVSLGVADAFVGDTATATYAIRKYNLANLKIAAPTEFGSEGHAFGVRKDWPLLVGILNKALNTITPQEHLQISKKWIEIEVDEFPVYWLWIAAITPGLLLILIAHNSILRRQVSRRTKEVSEKNQRLEEEITQKKRFEEKLKASEERLRQFFHATFEMVFFHHDGTIIDVNPATLTITGYSPEEVIGKNLLEFVTEESRQFVSENMSKGVEGPYEVGIITKRPENSNSPAEIHAKNININNRLLRVVSIRDIRERKKIEAELHVYRENLEDLVEQRTTQLHLVNAELQKFCYTVSHDLRAPLRSINGFSQALVEDYHDMLDDTAKGYLTRIHANTIHMGELIDDLLTLYRVSNNEIDIKTVNLSRIVTEYADSLKKGDVTRFVEFIIQENLEVNGDKRLLRVVIENLLDNAWKYTTHVKSPCIRFNHEKKDGKDIYCCRDNGAGFDMRYVNKLFNAFSRLHSYDEFPGNGIGLASVERIIKRHGGQVWAHGEVNQGATFCFSLAD